MTQRGGGGGGGCLVDPYSVTLAAVPAKNNVLSLSVHRSWQSRLSITVSQYSLSLLWSWPILLGCLAVFHSFLLFWVLMILDAEF